jgi:hypothetical protein
MQGSERLGRGLALRIEKPRDRPGSDPRPWRLCKQRASREERAPPTFLSQRRTDWPDAGKQPSVHLEPRDRANAAPADKAGH